VSDDLFKDWPWKLGDHQDPRQRAVALVPKMIELLTFFGEGRIDYDGSKYREAADLLARIQAPTTSALPPAAR
jgi:hypothetical protein